MRVGVVEAGHSPPLAHQTQHMPGQGHDHHPCRPKPKLEVETFWRWKGTSDQNGPDFVGDSEVHDHHRATKDQVEMGGDP